MKTPSFLTLPRVLATEGPATPGKPLSCQQSFWRSWVGFLQCARLHEPPGRTVHTDFGTLRSSDATRRHHRAQVQQSSARQIETQLAMGGYESADIGKQHFRRGGLTQ